VFVSKRSWGVLILDFGCWILGEEKPNGEFWILNFEWWIEDDVECWVLDSILIIQNFAACVSLSGEAVFLRVAVGFICRHGGNRPNWW
jgi:hypothetical protein